MMADATALRQTLLQTENNLPSIQSASRLMMRFYDTPSGADLAVSEWRSVLQSCSTSQMLPLLYVANEVLQTSGVVSNSTNNNVTFSSAPNTDGGTYDVIIIIVDAAPPTLRLLCCPIGRAARSVRARIRECFCVCICDVIV